MGGFGSGMSMITVLKNNKIIKTDRKKLFENKEFGRDGSYGPMVDHKKMNDYQRNVFMKKMEEKRKRDRKREFLTWGISIVLTGLIIWGVPKLLMML